LFARRQRPRGRANDQRYDLAPPHSTRLHLLPIVRVKFPSMRLPDVCRPLHMVVDSHQHQVDRCADATNRVIRFGQTAK
jgi:hypothetical protein